MAEYTVEIRVDIEADSKDDLWRQVDRLLGAAGEGHASAYVTAVFDENHEEI